VQEGKLQLTDPLSDYLPETYPNLEGITLQHLLTHTSGLPTFLPEEIVELRAEYPPNVPQDYNAIEGAYSPEKLFADLKEVTLATAPGTAYNYSNVGAELIGFVLTTVYGKSIDALLQEAILQGAGMVQTSVKPKPSQQEHLIEGYWMDNTEPSPPLVNNLWGTAGSGRMTMNDMLRYMAWQLNGDNPVVAESQRMLYDSGGSVKVAYFWRMRQDKYGTSYNHHGGSTGMQNWLFLFPDHNLGISVMTNQSSLKTPKFLAQTVQKILKDILKV
ncbi:MAG TPA: hypothetical protein DCE41_16050, partial [Cytophagales bacterium]|nr:hypothetical protein [Cytophagales bacterium]